MKPPARAPLWPTLTLLLTTAAIALNACSPQLPRPDPDELTVAVDGVAWEARPLLGDCNDNAVVDLVEVQHKPLGFGEPTLIAVSDNPQFHVQADFDGDGHLDLAIAYQDLEAVQILFNDGGGAFPLGSRVTLDLEDKVSTLAAGDFDDNGVADLAVAGAHGAADTITLFLNDDAAPGTFPTSTTYTVGEAAPIWTIAAMTSFDFDGSFGDDLAVIANRHGVAPQTDLFILASAGAGPLTTTRYADLPVGGGTMIAADLDNDSDTDVAIIGNDQVFAARNDGGSLTLPAGPNYSLAGGSHLAAADLDRDGLPELISADTGDGLVQVLPNTSTAGALQFDDDPASVRTLATPGVGSLAVADMDGDGLADIVVDGAATEQVSILLSQGDLLFEPVAYRYEAGVSVGRVLPVEFNGVAPPELTALSSAADRVVVFANASRISTDCNSNGVPDACDIASLRSDDCNANGIPDSCDVAHQVGLSSRAVWKHYVHRAGGAYDDFEIVETRAPLLGPLLYDPVLWAAPLDNDPDNELLVMNAWTGAHLRVLFNRDYGDFVIARNPAELLGGGSALLRNFIELDLGIGFIGEKAIAMASGEFTGDDMDDLAIVTLESAEVEGRDVTVTALKLVEQGRSGSLATWTVRDVIYEQPNPRLPPMRHVIAADFDGDGDRDLAVTPDLISSDMPHDPDLDVEWKIVLLRNDGDGTFHHDAAADIGLDGAVTSIAAQDLNSNDRLDIVVSSYSAPQVLVCDNYATRSGGFGFTRACRDFAAGSIPLAADIGDLDGDGFPEIVVANAYRSHVSVLRNSPVRIGIDPRADFWRASFDAPETVSVRGTRPSADPRDLALVDIDRDGDLDVVTANMASDSVTVLRNAGDGSFLEPLVFVAGPNPEALHVADLNRDARPDVAVANGNGDVTVLLNRSLTPRSADATGDGRPDECDGG
ncbi:MAG: VCBS repeat-containing protein [Gammaproteobacteria bacterium]|nr:VCBS repeat-containing protein [Gammaproteobacteria bacterium]